MPGIIKISKPAEAALMVVLTLAFTAASVFCFFKALENIENLSLNPAENKMFLFAAASYIGAMFFYRQLENVRNL